jgi:dienelactone hydrolase
MAMRDEFVELAIDDQHIAGRLIAPERAVAAVLFAHGWGGSQQQYLALAREVAGLGCVCMTFDLRGHGRTEEQHDTVSREKNLQDLLAAYDFLARQPGVDAAAIGLVGISYGAYLAAIMSSLRSVRWLALRAPALYKDGDWELPKQQLHEDPDLLDYRRRFIRSEDNRALKACAGFHGDVLIVESECDDVVPHAVVANYIAACRQARSVTSRRIEGADHALSETPWEQAYTSFLVNWLKEMGIGALTGHDR